MVATRSVVHSDPELMGGAPVFVGTRAPVDALFDYLAAGEGLAVYLDDFPFVRSEQAVEAVEAATSAILREVDADSV